MAHGHPKRHSADKQLILQDKAVVTYFEALRSKVRNTEVSGRNNMKPENARMLARIMRIA